MSAKVPNLLVVAILALLTITSSRAAGCAKQLASYHDAGCPALTDYTNTEKDAEPTLYAIGLDFSTY